MWTPCCPQQAACYVDIPLTQMMMMMTPAQKRMKVYKHPLVGEGARKDNLKGSWHSNFPLPPEKYLSISFFHTKSFLRHFGFWVFCFYHLLFGQIL
uniref:Uncharacterized protein n=1 Tax=Anguilla anguilla TaxID=7936 RepID=A0A0E9WNS0_ANGAN